MTDNQGFTNTEGGVTSFSTSNSPVVKDDLTEIRINDDSYSITSSNIPAPYAGMPKEVLLHYSRQKKFVWARNILTGAVILTILALLSMVIALIAVSPACQQFWQTSPIYQIYPASYYDSNEDGIGDLQGIKMQLGTSIGQLGVSAILLNSIYETSYKDGGYDVTNFMAVNPNYGNLADMEDLITNVHNEGMKIILDFIPNHTSDQHEWFIASSDPTHEQHEKYKDYYIWKDGASSSDLPNNWQSAAAGVGSAWKWNSNRNQFYYHALKEEQPDLNLRNGRVQEEIESILKFWFEKNIDGFRFVSVKYLVEAADFRDNPLKNPADPLSYANVYPDHTENLIESHDLIANWKKIFDEYSSEPGVYRFFETEAQDSVDEVIRYYGNTHLQQADFPMNYQLIGLEEADWTAANIEATIMEWMQKMPSKYWPNWALGSEDNSRVVTRIGKEKAKLAAMLTFTLSGTPRIYYGEEIGMVDGATINDTRDAVRTPMQWNDQANAGFCKEDVTPWLEVNADASDVNLQKEKEEEANSLFNFYQNLIATRSDVTFLRGYLCILNSTPKTLLYVRELPGTDSTLIAINFDGTDDTINLNEYSSYGLPSSGQFTFKSNLPTSESVNFNSLTIPGGTGAMVHFTPTDGKLFSDGMSERCFVSRRVCMDVLGLLEVC